MSPIDSPPHPSPHTPPLSTLRRHVRRVPGAHAAYRATQRVDREVSALGHWLRAEAGQRLRRAGDGVPLLQSPTVRRTALTGVVGRDALAAELRRRGLVAVDGRSGLYVPPQAQLAGALGELVAANPLDAGFTFVDPAAVGGTDGAIERLRAACVFCLEGLGPRPYDLVELPDEQLLAFVVAHVDGSESTTTACAAVSDRVHAVAATNGLQAIDAAWQQPRHFRDDDGEGSFVGWDHFRLADPAAPVRRLLTPETRRDLHFGLEYKLRGGRYLYQSIPTAGATGRRSTARRWGFIAELMRQHELSVRDRVVLDVGCNAGMMLGATLAGGAAWGLGWDREAVVRHGSDLLLSLGYTRHQLTPGELGPERRLTADVPGHLHARLDGAIVLYLAIRHHIGWVRELGEIPWRAIVYEGGEAESVATLEESLHGLRELCDFDVATAVDFRDSEGRARPVALLVRR